MSDLTIFAAIAVSLLAFLAIGHVGVHQVREFRVRTGDTGILTSVLGATRKGRAELAASEKIDLASVRKARRSART